MFDTTNSGSQRMRENFTALVDSGTCVFFAGYKNACSLSSMWFCVYGLPIYPSICLSIDQRHTLRTGDQSPNSRIKPIAKPKIVSLPFLLQPVGYFIFRLLKTRYTRLSDDPINWNSVMYISISTSITVFIAALSVGARAVPSPYLATREPGKNCIAGFEDKDCKGSPVPGIAPGWAARRSKTDGLLFYLHHLQHARQVSRHRNS